MTDEPKQLAEGWLHEEFSWPECQCASEYCECELSDDQHETLASLENKFREVQRQTVEAACRLLCPYCEYGMPAYPLNGVKTSNGKPFWHQDQFDHNLYHECKAAPIRALLSPAQEVRRGKG